MFFISVRVKIKHYFIWFQKMPYVKVSVVMRTFILMGQEKEEGGRRDNKVWKKSSSVFEGIIYLYLQIKPRKHPQALKQALHYHYTDTLLLDYVNKAAVGLLQTISYCYIFIL